LTTLQARHRYIRSAFSRTLARAALVFACASAQATVHVVTAEPDLTFRPASITIHQGDSIRFENYGGVHNVHADNNRFICSVNCTTDNAPSDEPWSVVVHFTQLGTFGYFCDQHGNLTSGMRGSITVIDRVFVDGFDTASPPD
jgi:plastocyanin